VFNLYPWCLAAAMVMLVAVLFHVLSVRTDRRKIRAGCRKGGEGKKNVHGASFNTKLPCITIFLDRFAYQQQSTKTQHGIFSLLFVLMPLSTALQTEALA
jgi:hypothetical protein